ncbi:MAG: aquaporin Z [Planctomycetaceae bacterium]
MRKLLAEAIGTFWLVLGGCGSALLAAAAPDVGIGWLGVSLAFGLTVLTMAVAIGHISGCHLNPAVTAGLAASGRFPARDVLGYVVAQCLGAIGGAAVLYLIARGQPTFAIEDGFAANGYGASSPGGFSLSACFIAEFVLTAFFVFVIHGATDKQSGTVLAPLAIGLCLTLIHLVSIPVTNTSVNPARSFATAFFAGGPAVAQLWLFWVAPILGGIFGGLLYKSVDNAED